MNGEQESIIMDEVFNRVFKFCNHAFLATKSKKLRTTKSKETDKSQTKFTTTLHKHYNK